MLLVLSLPIRQAGAVPLHCDAAPVVNVPVKVMHHAVEVVRADSAAAARAECQHADAEVAHTAHAAGQCGASASCCTGLAVTAPAILMPGFEPAWFHVVRPVSDAAPIFLTSGIDRPPRPFLS